MSRQIDYSSAYRSKFDFPRFKLKAQERARVVMIESHPAMELVHFCQKFGYILCLGDYNIVVSQTYDPNCPLCSVATPEKDAAVGLARRRFATNILRYVTNRALQPIEPTTVEILLWLFGEDKFSPLITATEVYKDLRRYDMLVECTEEGWQRFTLQVDGSKMATYLRDRSVAERIVKQYAAEKLSDLQPFLGRSLSGDAMADLSHRIMGTKQMPVLTPGEEAQALGLLSSLQQSPSQASPVSDVPAGLEGIADVSKPEIAGQVLDLDTLLTPPGA